MQGSEKGDGELTEALAAVDAAVAAVQMTQVRGGFIAQPSIAQE